MATSRRVGNYATSANAVVKSSDQIFDAAMSGRPDFTAISKEAIKGRSLERRTAMEAEGQVAKAGINALTKVKQTKIKADTAKEVSNIKKPARRMAGIVGGLGTLSGAMLLNKENQIAKRERAEDRAYTQSVFDKQQEMFNAEKLDREKQNAELMSLLKPSSSTNADSTPAVATAPSAPTVDTTTNKSLP